METLLACLTDLYGAQQAQLVSQRLLNLCAAYAPRLAVCRARQPRATSPPGPGEAVLITYADMVQRQGVPPLEELAHFAAQYFQGVVTSLHILPFFPYSSDDGFSVIDYRQVNPEFGGWQDITRLSQGFSLMFDLVINHVSAQSAWFEAFLRGAPAHQDYFITPQDSLDLSRVVRPRATPLLTSFDTTAGVKQVWTTFSADQVDLNFHNPEVLLEMVDILLFYLCQGAELIRLDAIGYAWKEPGTACINLPQVHRLVQLLRAVLDRAAPWARLVTETNVPHAENTAYFGDGTNEAQMVYNFALPPLVLHAFHTSSSQALAQWAAGLLPPSPQAAFFNFLASHDGIGLNPVRGILAEEEIDALVQRTLAHQGHVSYKSNPDGSSSPYELNINYFDALSDPRAGEPEALQVERFLCAQAIMLALSGVPGIYFHSLVGSRGWPEGVRLQGARRAINRQKLQAVELEGELSNPASLRSQVYHRYAQLLQARAGSPAFDHCLPHQVIPCGPAVFGLLRQVEGCRPEQVLCLHNLSASPQVVAPVPRPAPAVDSQEDRSPGWIDLLSQQAFSADGPLWLAPYQALWLRRL